VSGSCAVIESSFVEAARIVTGLPIFTISILIYKELGWESLAERRTRGSQEPVIAHLDQSCFQ
jgi:hypothetical protein